MSKLISIRVPDDMYDWLQETATAECRTVSNLVISRLKPFEISRHTLQALRHCAKGGDCIDCWYGNRGCIDYADGNDIRKPLVEDLYKLLNDKAVQNND